MMLPQESGVKMCEGGEPRGTGLRQECACAEIRGSGVLA